MLILFVVWTSDKLKGILPQKKFHRPNLIFWIVMGCGNACFGRKGQNTTWNWKFWSQSLFPGTSRRPAHGTSKQLAMGPRGNPHGPRGRQQWFVQVASRSVRVGSRSHRRLSRRSLVLVMKKLPFSWNLTQLLTINNFMTMCMSAMKDLTWQKKRVTKSETCLKAIWTSSPHFARSRALKPPMRFNPNRRWSTTTRSLVSSLTQRWSWLRQFSGKRWC